MFSYTWKRELLADILTDALEGGMSSWSQVEAYRWEWWYNDDDMFKGLKDSLTNDTVLMRVREFDSGGNGRHGPWVDVTLGKLQKAANQALHEYKHLFWFIAVNAKINDLDYDAIGADVILQFIVLGKVIYG